MKKIFTKISLAFVLFLTISRFSYSQTYYFSMSNGTYTNLVDATTINGSTVWDNQFYFVPIGFNFTFFGNAYDSVHVGDVGGFFDPSYDFGIEVFSADLCDRGQGTSTSLSSLLYVIEGSAPNRIFKLEYNNAGFKQEFDFTGSCLQSTNAQLWLYETSNDIDVRMGPNDITNPNLAYWPGENGPFVGLAHFSASQFAKLDGSPSSPTLVNADSSLDGTPSNGAIYHFSLTPAGLTTRSDNNRIEIFPNPVSDFINIRFENPTQKSPERFEIMDATGRILGTTLALSNGNNEWKINAAGLTSGFYLLGIHSGETIYTQPFVVE